MYYIYIYIEYIHYIYRLLPNLDFSSQRNTRSFRCFFFFKPLDGSVFSRLLNWQLALGNAFTSAVWELVQASSCLGDIWSLKGWMNCKHWVLSGTFSFNMRLKYWNHDKDVYILGMYAYIYTIYHYISLYIYTHTRTLYFHESIYTCLHI